MVLATSCMAHGTDSKPRFTEGVQYVTIKHPERLSSSGKIEVVEVFSYGCPHCAHFAPYAEELRASLPKDAQFKLLPASFSPAWEPYARAYYAAQELGVLKRTHLALFKQKFEEGYPMNTLDELGDFYAREGVNKADFMAAANSARTDQAMRQAYALMTDWGIDATPTIVVDGKYRSQFRSDMNPGGIKNYKQLLQVARYMIKLAERDHAGAAGGK
jgi:protein dithiol oxidoreductase (disulfide-forming)